MKNMVIPGNKGTKNINSYMQEAVDVIFMMILEKKGIKFFGEKK